MPHRDFDSDTWIDCIQGGKSERIQLADQPLVFGRELSCDQACSHKGMSRRHFELKPTSSGWIVVDLGSSNGTLVNGTLAERHLLLAGDEITIGGDSQFAPVRWIYRELSNNALDFSLDEFDEPESEERDTSFAFDMAELDEQIISGDFFQKELPSFSPQQRGVLGNMLRSQFEDDSNADDSRPAHSGHEKANSEFNVTQFIALFSQMGQALLDSQDIDQLLTRTLDLIFKHLPAERGSVWLCDLDTGEVSCRGSRNRRGDRSFDFEISKSIARETVESQRSLLIRHVSSDERFCDAESIAELNILSAMCSPLYHKGEVRGFFYVDSSAHGDVFSNDHLGVLTAMAMFTAIGIEKIRNYQDTLAIRQHLESVLQSINHLVFTLDQQGRLQTINRSPEQQLGVSEEKMRVVSYSKWFGNRNRELVEVLDRVYKKSEPEYLADYGLVGDSERTSSINCTVVPLLDFQNVQRGIVAIMEDVTREKRMADTLGRYLSPALAQRVLQDGEARLGGVRQKVTVLFSDIRSYTALTEALDAHQIVEMLNGYFTSMVEVIYSERGLLDKYIGDAIMAVFGVPFTEADDPVRACRTALGMQNALACFNEIQRKNGLLPIRIGIGLSSGHVITGNIGSEKRLEYTCIGDGVNLASRIEGATKLYGVTTLISEFTNDDIGDAFVTREVDKVRVMGKQQPIRIFELIAETSSELSHDNVRTLEYYSAGLRQYRARDWMKASKFFSMAINLTNDGPSSLMLERCNFLQSSLTDETWDGTWDLDQK